MHYKNRIALILALIVVASLMLLHCGRSEKPDVAFVFIGDNRPSTAGGAQPAVFSRLVREINLLDPDFIIHGGDMIFSVTDDDSVLKEQWREFHDIFNVVHAKKHYVPGNHEFWNELSRSQYKKEIGQRYYSFAVNKHLFIIFDNVETNEDSLKREIQWLENLLKESSRYKTISLFAHYPIVQRPELYLHALDMSRDFRNKLLNLIETYNVQTVFCSHLHLFSKSTYKNMTQYISGGAGAPLLQSVDEGVYHHFLYVKISGDEVHVEVKKEGDVLKSHYAHHEDALFDYEVYVPHQWEKNVISMSLKLSHVIFENPKSLNSLTIKCWKRKVYTTPRILITKLNKPYRDKREVLSAGYFNLRGNKGYETIIRQEQGILKYYCFMKQDNVYLMEMALVDTSNRKQMEDFANTLDNFVIRLDSYPREFADEDLGISYEVPDEWEFTSITRGRESTRMMINRIMDEDVDVTKEPQVFLDIRKNKMNLNARDIILESVQRMKSQRMPVKIVNEEESDKSNLKGFSMLLDISENDSFFQRRIICYTKEKSYLRFIIDIHRKQDNISKLSQLIKQNLKIQSIEEGNRES